MITQNQVALAKKRKLEELVLEKRLEAERLKKYRAQEAIDERKKSAEKKKINDLFYAERADYRREHEPILVEYLAEIRLLKKRKDDSSEPYEKAKEIIIKGRFRRTDIPKADLENLLKHYSTEDWRDMYTLANLYEAFGEGKQYGLIYNATDKRNTESRNEMDEFMRAWN